MSDTALNSIIQYGTNANRIAFTPNPAASSKVLYIWYTTDTLTLYVWDGAAWVQVSSANVANSNIRSIGITIGDGSSTISTGQKECIQIPFTCTITEWTILSIDASNTSGSIVIDIWKDTYANFPPTVADTITAAAKPTVSAAIKATSSTLTAWTTTITAGDVLKFNVDSVSTFTKVILQLKVSVP
jgi:hypothetical protein